MAAVKRLYRYKIFKVLIIAKDNYLVWRAFELGALFLKGEDYSEEFFIVNLIIIFGGAIFFRKIGDKAKDFIVFSL